MATPLLADSQDLRRPDPEPGPRSGVGFDRLPRIRPVLEIVVRDDTEAADRLARGVLEALDRAPSGTVVRLVVGQRRTISPSLLYELHRKLRHARVVFDGTDPDLLAIWERAVKSGRQPWEWIP